MSKIQTQLANPPHALSLAAAAALLIGAGWTLRAAARQTPPSPSAAAAKTTPAPARPRAGAKTETVTKSGPATTGDDKTKWADLELKDWKHDEKTSIDTGRDFIYKEDDMTVTGAFARHNSKTNILDAEGSLVMDDPKHHVTGDKARVDHGKKRLAVFDGNVVIVLKPSSKTTPADSAQTKPVDASDKTDSSQETASSERQNGGTITCDHVEDYYKRKFIIMTGHLVFTQHIKKKSGETLERTLTAEHAEYDQAKEEMVLFPPVQGHDSDGQTFLPKGKVIVGTKEGEETIQSQDGITIHIKVDENSDQDETDNGAKPEDGKKPDTAGKSDNKTNAGSDSKNGGTPPSPAPPGNH